MPERSQLGRARRQHGPESETESTRDSSCNYRARPAHPTSYTPHPRAGSCVRYGERVDLQSQEECTACPPGSWCENGFANLCANGTYNPYTGVSRQGGCIGCPAYSTTAVGGSTGADACACIAGYFLDTRGSGNTSGGGSGSGSACEACPVGTDCAAGSSVLEGLKLKSGFYRISPTSIDVRRCPDAGGGEVNGTWVSSKGYGLSGCLGGEDFALQCRDGLEGVFCSQCIENGTEPGVSRYYEPANTNADSVASCRECDGEIGLRLGALGLLILGMLCSASSAAASAAASVAASAATLCGS